MFLFLLKGMVIIFNQFRLDLLYNWLVQLFQHRKEQNVKKRWRQISQRRGGSSPSARSMNLWHTTKRSRTLTALIFLSETGAVLICDLLMKTNKFKAPTPILSQNPACLSIVNCVLFKKKKKEFRIPKMMLWQNTVKITVTDFHFIAAECMWTTAVWMVNKRWTRSRIKTLKWLPSSARSSQTTRAVCLLLSTTDGCCCLTEFKRKKQNFKQSKKKQQQKELGHQHLMQ